MYIAKEMTSDEIGRWFSVWNKQVTIKSDELKDLHIRHDNWSTWYYNDNEKPDNYYRRIIMFNNALKYLNLLYYQCYAVNDTQVTISHGSIKKLS
jgi:hypothetical protein